MAWRKPLTITVTCALAFTAARLPAQTYLVSTIAAGAVPAEAPTALGIWIGNPDSVAVDLAGDVYFTGGHCVFHLTRGGSLVRFAGDGRKGFSGDGGPAAQARLHDPAGVAFDIDGNVYIADSLNHRIRRVSRDGIITTIAGSGVAGNEGDGGAAVSASLDTPVAVAAVPDGSLFVLDFGNNRVRRVSAQGIITAFAGSGADGSSGDGGPALSATFRYPTGFALSATGDLYLADAGNHRIRRITNGIIATVAGNGIPGYSGDGGPATRASLSFPDGVRLDASGNLYISDSENFRIRQVTPNGAISTFAGIGTQGFSGDGERATQAELNYPNDVAVGIDGDIYIADSANGRIRRVSAGLISSVAGTGASQFNSPDALAVDTRGAIYYTNSFTNEVLAVLRNGTTEIVAGDGSRGFSGDGGAAPQARLNSPLGVAVDKLGNVYIADSGNHRIRKIAADKTITTIAGTGSAAFRGDGGAAASASLSFPGGLALDGSGNLFVADTGNNRVRKIATNGTISTYAGSGVSGAGGDGGLATSAQLSGPTSIALDASGNLYIADTLNGRIRRVSPAGVITTFADGLQSPTGLSCDSAGNVLVADTLQHVLRRYAPDGNMSVIAGIGVEGYSGDDGPAAIAQFSRPLATAVGGTGQIVVADSGNSAIRVLHLATNSTVLAAVVDAASEASTPIAPGKMVVLYGSGLGPSQLRLFPANASSLPVDVGGTSVTFNGTAAPVIYSSTSQVAALVPYGLSGSPVAVEVTYQGQTSTPLSVPMRGSAPSLFTANSTGAGQAAAINVATGAHNTATTPAQPGEYVALYATGEGRTTTSTDGRFAGFPPPTPLAGVTATVDGLPAAVQYAGGVVGTVAGLMQINVLIPSDARSGGYVPVAIRVGGVESAPGVWISVAAK